MAADDGARFFFAGGDSDPAVAFRPQDRLGQAVEIFVELT
jgi:hypothetical protein